MPRVNYITKLQQENEELRRNLEQKDVIMPLEKENPSQDYRDQEVTIWYGRNTQSMAPERIKLGDGFNKLVDYYSSFNNTVDRNVPRSVSNRDTADSQGVNNQTVYAKITQRDNMTKRKIETYRDMFLWLAVDYQVQQNKQIELVSEEEFLEWYKEEQIKDRKSDNKFRNMLQQKELEAAVEREIAKRVKESNGDSIK